MRFVKKVLLAGVFIGSLFSAAYAVPPIITENTPVPVLSADSTPQVTITSDQNVTLTYAGACGVGDTANLIAAAPTVVTFPGPLGSGLYNDCVIFADNTIDPLVPLALTAFTIDVTAPTLQSFTSVTGDATYGPTDTINITATYDEPIQAGGTLNVVLDNGQAVILNAVAGNNVSGTYTVGATGSEQDSADLTVASITTENVSDALGNNQTTSVLPGINIAAGSDIVIDTTAPTLVEVTAVVTPTTDTTPAITISTDENNTTLSYSGGCTGPAGPFASGTHTISFGALADGTYATCGITAQDANLNTSALLPVTAFEIDTTSPVFTAMDLANEAADGVIDLVESVSVLDFASNLQSSGHTSDEYLLATSAADCSLQIGYAAAIPVITDLAADGTSKLCIKLADTVGNTTYGQTSDVLRDTVLPQFSSIGVTSDNTFDPLYARSGNKLSFTLTLGAADTYAGGGSVNFTIGATPILIPLLEVASDTPSATYTAEYTVTNQNGAINVTNVTYSDFLAQGLTGFSAGAPTPTATVDTVDPAFTSIALQNEAANFVVTAAESASALDLVGNLSASGYDTDTYVIAADSADCSETIGYGAAVPAINDLSADGAWKVCVRLNDNAGNTVYGASPSVLRETALPQFSSIGVTSNNVFDPLYAKSGEQLSFTMDLVIADSYAGAGSIDFTIGGVAKSIPFAEAASASAGATYTASYTIVDENGPIVITGINYQDYVGQDLIGFAPPAAPSPTVTIDTTYPVFTSIDTINEAVDKAITLTESGSVLDTVGNLSASGHIVTNYQLANSGADCTTLSSYVPAEPIVTDLTSDGSWKVCVQINDAAGNITHGSSAIIVRDTLFPQFSSIGVLSDNPFDASYGRQGSVLTFTMQLSPSDSYAGGGSVDITIGGTPVTIPFVEGASTSASATYTATHTITTENGLINVTGINFNDAYGQAIQNFVAGVPAPTVVIDSQAATLAIATVSTSGNAGWARNNQIITYSLGFSEDIVSLPVSATTATNVSAVVNKDLVYPVFTSTGTIDFIVTTGDNGLVQVNTANLSLQDRAGNPTTVTAATINALIAGGTEITADTTRPTISNVSIASNNAFDPSLAKTNDTITVSVTTADNLSPTVTLNSEHILNMVVTDGISGAVGARTMSRFTDGTEVSEQITPFQLRVRDEAGNNSVSVTSTTDGSSVGFDQTTPVVQNVRISALSQDGTAYLGDVPTYYARQGDSMTLSFEASDWVDILPGIQGTVHGAVRTFAKTNPACDGTIGWCEWSTTIASIDGDEEVVDFDILVIDNAGNGNGTTNPELHITGTTDGSQVIFDKTIPVNPTDVADISGAPTTSFKAATDAEYSWSNDYDPLPISGTNAGIWKYFLALTNPDNGGEFHKGDPSNLSEDVLELYDALGNPINSKNFDATVSKITGIVIPPRDITPVYEPYHFRMLVVDKAGNKSYDDFGDPTQLAGTQPQVAYEQPYTVVIYGVVTGEDGQPIPNTVVQVSARYGLFCNGGQEVCTDTTDSLGRYSILVNKTHDYVVTFFAGGHYTNKKDRRVLADNFELDVSLTRFENIHEQQTFSEVVRLILNKSFLIGDRYEYVQFDIYTNSGQITTSSIADGVAINSLSTITHVRQMMPYIEDPVEVTETPVTLSSVAGDITISRVGNEWQITGGGGLHSHNGESEDYDSEGNENYYGGRLGVELQPRNGVKTYSGDTRPTRGHIWTADDVKDISDIDKGNAPAIVKYTNFNGYEIFAGYRAGRLPMEKRGARYRNRVRVGVNVELKEGESLSQKIEEMKKLARSEKEEITEEKDYGTPLVRRKPGDEAKSEIARRNHQAKKIDKFARFDPESNPPSTILKAKQYENMHMIVGGRRVSMNKVMGLAHGGN